MLNAAQTHQEFNDTLKMAYHYQLSCDNRTIDTKNNHNISQEDCRSLFANGSGDKRTYIIHY